MNRHYLIDHRHLFLFGYFFYLFVPYVAGVSQWFSGFPGIELYQAYFQQIPAEKLRTYLLVSLVWLPSFFLGHGLFHYMASRQRQLVKFPANAQTNTVFLPAVLLFLTLLVFGYLARGSLFSGYTTYDVGVRGKVSTLLAVFNFYLIYQLLSRSAMSWLLVAGVTLTAMMLLSMGGRMYVFQTMMLLLVYKTSFADKRWGIFSIVCFLFGGFLVGTAFGIWRMGGSFNFERAGYSFFAEPVFTWFSTSTFLINNEVPWFNFPTNFLTSFFNLVPNSFFSLKKFMVSAQGMGYRYENPLGADSVWSTLVINFGAIGSCFFLAVTGFVLNGLRHWSQRNHFGAAYYLLVCSILPFQFFRDGFYILNKQLFFNFLLLPLALLFVHRLFLLAHYLQHRLSATASSIHQTPVINTTCA